jgi:hypothetical protein
VAASRRRPLRPAISLVLGVLVLVLVPSRVSGGDRSVASADLPNAYTATATPVDGLLDGQTVHVNVKSNPGFYVYQGFLEVCRTGVTYQPSSGITYNDDARPNGPNCPLAPVSSSADAGVSDTNMINTAASPEGDTIPIRVGVGTVDWTDTGGVKRSLTCDPTNPCSLVTELFAGPKDGSTAPLWVPFVQQLTFADSNPLATCGGAANGALSTGGSDALLDAWTKWTLSLCKQPGQKGAATKASFVGEGTAVQQFDAGALDLAYTASASDPTVGLDTDGTKRPYVAVPIALGAEVVGVGNGYGANGKKVPFPTLDVLPTELGALVASGQFTPGPVQASMTTRNPDLSPYFFAQNPTMQVGVPSGTSSSTYFLSHYLSTAAPDDWRVPMVGAAGADAGKPRGVFNDFGTASPDFTLLTTYTGRPALRQSLFAITSNNFLLGGVYVVSDLTTSIAEGLAPVAIQNTSTGPFVAPDQASMAAAVAEMQPDDHGVLLPPAQQTDPNAYPLTYVEYAMVPAQPLVDATCVPRPASQAQLTSWLNYLVGPGQQDMVDGLVPLPPALVTQAKAAIAKVGATPNTCKPPPKPVVPPPTKGPTGSPSGTSTGAPVGASGSGSPSSGTGTAPSSAVVTPGPSVRHPVKELAATVPIPPYKGSSAPSGLITVLALVGIVALVSFAVRYTSGTRQAGGSADGDAGS